MKTTITTEVELSTLDKDQLLILPVSLLVDEILELRETIRTLKSPTKARALPGLESLPTEATKGACEENSTRDHSNNGTLGIKTGRTSKYHYVYIAGAGGKVCGSISHMGSTHNIYRGTDEVDAALAVDGYLDEINDTKRPRNRDEFDEVKLKYATK